MLDLAEAYNQLRHSAQRHRNPVSHEISRAIRAVLDKRPVAARLDPVDLNEIDVAALAERIRKPSSLLAAAMSRDDISRRLLNGDAEDVVRVAATLLHETAGRVGGDHWTASWLLPTTITVGDKHSFAHAFPLRESMHDLAVQLRQFAQQLRGKNGATTLRHDPFRLWGFRRTDWYLPQAPGWLAFNRKCAAWRGFNVRIPDAVFEAHWPKFDRSAAQLRGGMQQRGAVEHAADTRWLLLAVRPEQSAELIAAATDFIDGLTADLELLS